MTRPSCTRSSQRRAAQRQGDAPEGFKQINDRHGHQAGDLFLAALAERPARGLRRGDPVACYGGDAFVVVRQASPGCTPDMVRQRLGKRTAGRYQAGALTIDVAGASVGVVEAPAGADAAEAVLREADAAMYVIKRTRQAWALTAPP
ncbi:MAG: GGDEF domain-containing protein [Pseudomonadota bacterium]|nr:GGDEF domain-containing protein [Pseudomonadota bacterium]